MGQDDSFRWVLDDLPMGVWVATALARKGVERIATITRDLKTFSRSDDIKLAPVDMRVVVESVLKLVRKEIEARARLRLSLADVPPVLGSEARLVQVLLNLLLNAAQSLGGGSTDSDEVSLTLRSEADRVVVEVGDTGPGVPAAEREPGHEGAAGLRRRASAPVHRKAVRRRRGDAAPPPPPIAAAKV